MCFSGLITGAYNYTHTYRESDIQARFAVIAEYVQVSYTERFCTEIILLLIYLKSPLSLLRVSR